LRADSNHPEGTGRGQQCGSQPQRFAPDLLHRWLYQRVHDTIPGNYDNTEVQDEEIGIESIIDLPILPVTPLRKEHINIITAIGDGVASLDELVLRMNPQLKKTSEEFPKERSRLIHHIKNFESTGLIVKEKSGKNVGIRVTALGEMVGAE
jgi:hypothetical protein